MAINYMQMLLDLMEERQKWLSQRDEAIREISRLSELIRATMNMIPADQIARYEPIFERLENRPAGLSMAIRACFTGGAAPALFLAERYKGAKNKEVESKAEKASPAEGGRGTGREAEGGREAGREAEGGREAGREAEGGRPETTGIGSERTGSEKDAAWLTPVEIRDALKRMGFPFENYKANPLASIHTTLKRMVPGELETKTLKDGQRVYRLKSAGEWTEAFAEVRQWLRGSYSVIESAGNVVIAKRNQKDEKDQEAEQAPPTEGAKRGTSGGA
jgi:hypothetical protein